MGEFIVTWITLTGSGRTSAAPSPRPPDGVRWPPPPRAPLPPLPLATGTQPGGPAAGCWSSAGDYTAAIPFTPPPGPDRLYHRGNFQLKIPGFTGGFNDKDRSICMTWEFPAYAERDQDAGLDYYASRYTHLLSSIPQTRNLGKTLADLKRVLEKAKARGLYNVLNVLGGDGENFTTEIIPLLDALAGLPDELCVAWQIDAGNKINWDGTPYTQCLCSLTEHVAAYAHPKHLLVSQHWINGSCALWPDSPTQAGADEYRERGITDRFSYGEWAAEYVDIQHFQTDTETQIDETQSGASKVIQGLYGPTVECVAEYEAQAQYDDPGSGREPYQALKGYLLASAVRDGRYIRGGYFNDACRPTGEGL